MVLLATPLNVFILRALTNGPQEQSELRRAAGSPAQTTLRAQLKRLVDLSAIEKRRRNRFPGVLEYELTAAGRDLLVVAEVLDRWLAEAPGGPLGLESIGAKAAIKALTEGWSTTMVRALAAKPLSLTELDSVIAMLNYPSLERRLGAMRLAGQIEAAPSNGRGTPYAVTDWLRQGVAPLATSAWWERRHRPQETAPISRLDVEAILLLTAPLIRLGEDLSGTCRIAAELPNAGERRVAGAMVSVEHGRVASCATGLSQRADAWALGSPVALIRAAVAQDVDALELGGDISLARSILGGMHGALFKVHRESFTDTPT